MSEVREEFWDGVQDIVDGPRYGAVLGIEFDFRHPDIPPPSEWRSPAAAYTIHGLLWPELNSPGPSPGDSLSVRDVKRAWRGRPSGFEDSHDTHFIHAYLRLTKTTGEVIDLDEPLEFVARDAIGPYFEPLLTFSDESFREWTEGFLINYEKIRRRIDRLAGPEPEPKISPTGYWGLPKSGGPAVPLPPEAIELYEAGTFPPGYGQITIGRYRKRHIESDWLRLALNAARTMDVWTEGADDDQVALGLDLMDAAAAAGYALAMAEMEMRVAPLAIKGAEARDNLDAAHNGRRRQGDPVRQAAQEFIWDNPNTSQSACAQAVALRLNKSVRTVERAILHMFEGRNSMNERAQKRPKAEFRKRPTAP